MNGRHAADTPVLLDRLVIGLMLVTAGLALVGSALWLGWFI